LCGYKVSNDPLFGEKVAEIVGLCLDPPERAVVLCVDEKSQIQAPDRTQPGLPLKKGRAATMTHDYKRHGTTTLFAALDVKSGLVIGDCRPRHQSREFLRFPRRIDRAVKKPRHPHRARQPRHPQDVRGTGLARETSPLQAALHAHQRILDEPGRALLRPEITAKRIRLGSHSSVDEPEGAIYDYLLQCSAKPKPFVRGKTAEDIIARERRALDALDEIRRNR